MNRHPERPWRGLYPPPTGESSAWDTAAFPSSPINLTLITMGVPYLHIFKNSINYIKNFKFFHN